jgi:hypothetical protein
MKRRLRADQCHAISPPLPCEILALLNLISKENVSLQRNCLRSRSFASTGWLSILLINFTIASRRCCTNVPPKCGMGGTTTSGLLIERVLYGDRKAEYAETHVRMLIISDGQ